MASVVNPKVLLAGPSWGLERMHPVNNFYNSENTKSRRDDINAAYWCLLFLCWLPCASISCGGGAAACLALRGVAAPGCVSCVCVFVGVCKVSRDGSGAQYPGLLAPVARERISAQAPQISAGDQLQFTDFSSSSPLVPAQDVIESRTPRDQSAAMCTGVNP